MKLQIVINDNKYVMVSKALIKLDGNTKLESSYLVHKFVVYIDGEVCAKESFILSPERGNLIFELLLDSPDYGTLTPESIQEYLSAEPEIETVDEEMDW